MSLISYGYIRNTYNVWMMGVFQILVKGTVGSGFLGDIAVDDITFTSTAGCSRKYIDLV